MVRQVSNRLESSQELNPISRPQSTRVVSRPVDTTVAPEQSDLNAFLGSLSTVQPSLTRYLNTEAELQGREKVKDGTVDAMLGKEQQSEDELYAHGYLKIKGTNAAQTDLEELKAHLETSYNPDTDDFDTTVRSWLQEKTGGLTDKSYLQGYAPVMDNAIGTLKATYQAERIQNLKNDTRAQGLQYLTTGMKSFLDRGEPVPEDWLDNFKTFAGTNLKISKADFNELQFQAAKEIGDTGNFSVYEQFKRPRTDGTPGMYFIPEWKAKIDAAEWSSRSRFVSLRKESEAAARADREQRQDNVLSDTFVKALTGDYEGAMKDFKKTISDNPGLFQASAISEWTGKFSSLSKSSQMEETEGQKVNATNMLAGIYEGGVGIKNILRASTSGQISYTQSRQLLDSYNSYAGQNRAIAAANANQAKTVFQSIEYTSGKEYLTRRLKPMVTLADPLGTGTQGERMLQANALYELATSAQGLQPKDVPALVESIRKKYEEQLWKPRYATATAALEAVKRGDMDIEEMNRTIRYFQKQAEPKK